MMSPAVRQEVILTVCCSYKTSLCFKLILSFFTAGVLFHSGTQQIKCPKNTCSMLNIYYENNQLK